MCELCDDDWEAVNDAQLGESIALDHIAELGVKIEIARKLAAEILTINPTSGELGEGKARRLIELADEVLRDS